MQAKQQHQCQHWLSRRTFGKSTAAATAAAFSTDPDDARQQRLKRVVG